MAKKSAKLRLGRIFRRRRRQVEDVGAVADAHIERHFVRRLVSLDLVKRFMFGWLALVAILILATVMQIFSLNSYYKEKGPVAGGVYSEGIIGTYKNANPIYASGTVDSSVSRLVFSGLLKYDGDNKLVGDLAESWKIDASEKQYTFNLRKGVKWHDGHPFTAQDVVFTIKTIQNPRASSSMRLGWSEVKVEAKDKHTVVFTLPSIYGAFLHSLTVGILPEHILKDVSPDQLRASDFNNVKLIGTGPFEFEAVEIIGEQVEERRVRVGLSAYDDYHLGRPAISKFTIRTFVDDKSLIEGYKSKEIDAMVGLSSVPEELKEDDTTMDFSIPLTAEVMVFFRTTQDILQDKNVRNALVLGSNRPEVIESAGYPLAVANSPLLAIHPGYSEKLVQHTNRPKEANKLLDKAGWKRKAEGGIREKNGIKLNIELYAQAADELSKVAKKLQEQWKKLGVEAEVVLQDRGDIQTTTSLHNYDALLSTISIGPDPDVFAYWHSTQADVRSQSRLNLSEYRSELADQALELGRARTNYLVRSAKYESFLEAWIKDAPALALYQPRLLYIVRSPLYGFDVKSAASAADRYDNVQDWMVREELLPKTSSE